MNWTEKTTQYFVENFGKLTNDIIAENLECTTRDLVLKRRELKLPLKKEEVGQTYGRLTITSFGNQKQKNRTRKTAICLCKCGNNFECPVNSLKDGTIISCGCYQKAIVTKNIKEYQKSAFKNFIPTIFDGVSRRKIEIGDIFNKLKLIEMPYKSGQKYFAKFECECGKECIKDLGSVKSGGTMSCGCFNKEQTKNMLLKRNSIKISEEETILRNNKRIQTNLNKYGFPYYNKGTSKNQKSIAMYLETITNKKFKSDWDILDSREIDIYNDELKFGIEYCGIKWHAKKTSTYHQEKYKKAKEKNVRLLTIFSDEWDYKQDQVKSFISGSLGLFNSRIFARKCTITEISKKDGFEFINKYHILGGSKKSKVYFGLKHNKELVGVMSFGLHHRQGFESKLVLDRLVYKPYIQIIGGSSKLLNQGIIWAKKEGFKEIISWSDNRWSWGNVYIQLGFELDAELKPDYSYVNNKNTRKRISKQSMTRKKLGCKEGETESEKAKELGFSKIWDCGKIRWKLEI